MNRPLKNTHLWHFPHQNAKNAQNCKIVQQHDYQQLVISLHFTCFMKAMLLVSESISFGLQKHRFDRAKDGLWWKKISVFIENSPLFDHKRRYKCKKNGRMDSIWKFPVDLIFTNFYDKIKDSKGTQSLLSEMAKRGARGAKNQENHFFWKKIEKRWGKVGEIYYLCEQIRFNIMYTCDS